MTITSEELQRVRKLTGQSSAIFSRNTVEGLLDHIDAQAAQVDSLKTQLSIAAERAGINFDRAEAAEKLAEFRGQNPIISK